MFSSGWQGYPSGFPSGFALGKSLGVALPALGKHSPSLLFSFQYIISLTVEPGPIDCALENVIRLYLGPILPAILTQAILHGIYQEARLYCQLA